MIVHRNDIRDTLARLLAKLTDQAPPAQVVVEQEPEETEEQTPTTESSEGND